MSTPRRSFYGFLQTQRHRKDLAGQVARELLDEQRRFTPFSAFEFLLTGPKGHFDDEYAALSQLIAEYEREGETA
jgi:hypothetical protein